MYLHDVMDLHTSLLKSGGPLFSNLVSAYYGNDIKNKKASASSVNRTRASSMATTNSTTRPMMLRNQVDLNADSLVIYSCLVLMFDRFKILISGKG
ncbi:hypothetical protein ACN38_g8942 [Penicillium nordicum]|uniref:Uncharacterized protein n=1 Tax=Penicillium nordicum TaxID=229535 RepID=A0A0M8P2W4_9EURO|nr:hypothetical protein ACN38_g8942 [Penicillium nordicum]